MLKTRFIGVVLVSLCGGALAQGILPGGHVAPVAGGIVQVVEGKEARMRRPHTVRLLLRKGEQFAVRLGCQQVGRYDGSLTYRISSGDGDVLRDGSIPVGGVADVQVPDAEPGLYTLWLDAGMNSCSVRSDVRHVTYEASETSPLQMIYHAPKLYFWVPAGAESVSLTVGGGGKNEAAAFSVYDASGGIVAEGNSHADKGTVTMAVGADQDGTAWSVVLSKLGDITFEDFSLFLGGDAVPFVAESAGRLVVPALHPYALVADAGMALGVRVNVDVSALGKHRLVVTVKDGSSDESLFAEQVADVHPGRVGTTLPFGPFQSLELAGQLLDAEGKTVLSCERSLAVAHGRFYDEIPNIESHQSAPMTLADQQRGYQVFARGEPGDIRPNSHPRTEEIVDRVVAVVTPGEYETLYVALHPLQDASSVQVELGDFRDGQGAVLAGVDVDLRWVACWPQLTNWRSSTYHVIPELLEKKEQGELQQGVPQQFAAIVNVPETAPPGDYDASLRVRIAGVLSEAVTVRLSVQPFRLRKPAGIVWGLYPDTARWKTFDDGQIEAEMRSFQAHGINTLMMYPQWNSAWALDDGKLRADFSEFRRRMRLYRRVGLGSPMVISIQGGEGVVRGLIKEQTGQRNEDPDDVYLQLLRLIKAESVAGDWPEFCLHSVDEPHSGPTLEAALRTLRVIKGEGFKTFNTCYGKAVRETLDPYLDYRCYNNIGFLSFPKAEAAEALRAETLATGDTFWWYGTGCYTNMDLIQDGNVIVNRFMGGFHFWRTGATGCWAWTFLRAKGNVFDDFDGGAHRENKDACIAYPTRDGKALTPTLQWEGIREGVDDYLYVYTLSELIREARESGDAGRRARADAANTELQALLADMPWTCREGAFTNGDATRTRERIAELCVALLAR
ncbi:MAG: hypothetical protein HN742_01240 [Lentisphaerae bacterium]|jgi:hypothetical protein|nr:hypothetical protein [Lentisphaerota bacterium]MBT4815630.1 hypothetical protein [Lentisphaerota bacterium]MBT5612522.1 hypothetical protein [Lentisphaerota bacterium]MBT7061317.1 hypothetical protein [Lentisphaerota bacterium]MBT7840458.1 hypothetical protein [Lentisphaerota bacterium]